MSRFLLFCAAILVALGCERATLVSDTDSVIRVGGTLILQGFSATDTAVVGPEGYRVGGYYDFSPFDNIKIEFSAMRLNPGEGTSHILVRVGPVNYFSDSLLTHRKEVSIVINRTDLAKPQSSALTFFAPDGDGPLIVSHLRVNGW
jgi:hypothetical protein